VTILLVYLVIALLIGVGVTLWVVRTILKPALVLSRNAMDVLTRGRVLVRGRAAWQSPRHHGRGPDRVVNALADSALKTQEALRPGNDAVPENGRQDVSRSAVEVRRRP
jgi:hypothetical protein